MCRSRFTCTRQPDRYDVQPESQAHVAIVTRQPDRYDVQPESQALLLCRRMHGSSRFATSPPYQRVPPIGQHPPPTPRQSQPGLDWPSGVPGNARGADAHFWAAPPSVVGRDGLAIGRFGRFPELPAVILYLRPPPPINNRDHPPPSEVGPVVARAEFGSQSSPTVAEKGHNTCKDLNACKLQLQMGVREKCRQAGFRCRLADDLTRED